MTIGRDDCDSLMKRMSGTSIVCAEVISLHPFTVKDSSGTAIIVCGQDTGCDVGDWAYFMLECNSTGPPNCTHVTIVPPWAESIARYQLLQYRAYCELHESPQQHVQYLSPLPN